MAETNNIKRRVGDIVAIKLKDGSYSFGIVLEEPLIAFYDCNFHEIRELEVVISEPILFMIWVMNSSVESGRWEVVGNTPLESSLDDSPRFFKQDPINKSFSICFQGKETPSTLEECQNLERAAVWDPEHVEDRLIDHYAGVPNQWVESLKAR